MKRKRKARLLFNAVRYSWLKYVFIGMISFALGSIVYTLVSYIRLSNVEISEVYASLGALETEGNVEITARLGDEYLSQGDKLRLVAHVAEGLGITVEDDPSYTEDKEGSRVLLTRQNTRSSTSIRLVSLNDETGGPGQKHYLIARIGIKADEGYDVIYYQERLMTIMDGLDAAIQDNSLLLTGSFEGRLQEDERNEIADKVCGKLGGSCVLEDRTKDSCNLYLYTPAIDRYVETAGERINAQILIRYDGAEDKTRVSIATPIINQDW